MTLLRATVTGNLTQALDQEVRKVAAALRRAVATTGQQVQGELRAQARGTGFKDGGRSVANAWRLQVFPRTGVGPKTLRPAALVWSRMPDVVTAFDRGAPIRAKAGKYLAFPTGYNAGRGRRNAGRRGGMRVTPEQMIAAGKRGEAFVLPSKSNPRVRLWCLRVAGAYGTTQRTRKRLRLFVGESTEVVTGKVKGLQQRRRDVLKQGFVPMFFLMRQVSLRKRLDVEGVRRKAPRWFAANAARELAR
jgi:hypothetical protein